MTWVERKGWRAPRFRRRAQALTQLPAEAYLRTDIACGWAGCASCPHSQPSVSRYGKVRWSGQARVVGPARPLQEAKRVYAPAGGVADLP